MKQPKFAILVTSLFLLTFVLAACSSASAKGSEFPTGTFVSKESTSISYTFNKDQTWQYYYYGGIGAEGKYSVKGNQWTEKGTKECPFPGTYAWTFDGSNLTFKLVGEDKCEPRREATDGQTFVMQK
ncbi:MAG: hypothetical protein JW757_14185 [Anaerolineales bacterium]|nr:hypothetical protein [Anaerolineales bacterium]